MGFHELYKQAVELHKSGKIAEAERQLEYLGSLKPNDPFVIFALANIDHETGRPTRAVQLMERVTQMQPDWSDAWCNLGVFYKKLGITQKAREAYAKGLELKPTDEMLLSNMSGSFINEGEPEQALKWANECLKHHWGQSRARHHKALALMEMGRWSEGFALYDDRLRTDEHKPYKRPYTYPRWRGEKVGRLLIHGEQGLGDEILFCGWVSRAKQFADEIVIEATDRLVKVFERSFGCKVFADPKDVMASGPFDAYIPMGSLPQIFAVTDRDMGGYIKPDMSRVAYIKEKLAEYGPGPYIGYSWVGGTMQTHGRLRASPRSYWEPLMQYGTPISVQYGEAGPQVAEDLGIPHWPWLADVPEKLVDLIYACDLVVTVNNTAVHMSGGLGRKCFTLTPSKPAWRYQLSGESIPWYSSVKQFRQIGDDWKPAFKQLEADIADFAGVRGNQQAVA